MKDTVVIAGATGYIGRALVECLRDRFNVVGISRGQMPSEPGVEWRCADLYSLVETRRALAGARYAIYLVHSMSPSARLTQATFEDLDLLIADNFARAAADAGAEQIVYLGGIVPSGPLSRHLQSRLEVEQTLAAHGVPVTTLRAGLVVGPHASSLPILVTLVKRLPLMLLPKWTKTPTQPIALEDVLTHLQQVMGARELYGKHFDIGGPEVLSHRDMMRIAARELGVKPHMIAVPAVSPKLSKLWVSLITGAPMELVGPLVESLKHPMLVSADNRLELPGHAAPVPFAQALHDAVNVENASDAPAHARAKRRSTVRSVQRLVLPPGHDATWIADRYREWLPHFTRPFLRVTREAGTLRFNVVGLRTPLLVLKYSEELSSPNRGLYYITGGLLARLHDGEPVRGRLEFRVVLAGKYVLAAIHDYEPRLPWYVYSATQALVHLVVMRAFGRYLRRLLPERLKVDVAG